MAARNLTAFSVLIFALSGCISGGTSVKPETMSQFHVGSTTRQQIIDKLGTPQSVASSSDGASSITYTGFHTSPKAIDFVPVIGAFAGGANAHSTSVTFAFGPDGVLKSTSSSNSDDSQRMGMTSGPAVK